MAIQTAKGVGKKFVFSRVEETRVVRLKKETSLFKHITLCNILDYLGETSTGREAIVVIGLQQGMLFWWVEDPRVPEFITRCEESQRKATQAGLDISDAWLVAVASCSLFAEKSFSDELPKFKGLPRIDQTWEKWIYHFQDKHEALECVIHHSNPSMDSFGSANAAVHIHGIAQNGDAVRPETNRGRVQVTPPGTIPADNFIESFRGLMDNMASAGTNDKAVLEQLVTTTTTQYATIKALLQ